MVDYPPEPHRSIIDQAFDSMHADLKAGRLQNLEIGLAALREALRPACHFVKRESKGGAEYRPLFMLDAVLLADNLRPVGATDESSLLGTVVKQLATQSISLRFGAWP